MDRKRRPSVGVPLAGPASGATDIIESVVEGLSELPQNLEKAGGAIRDSAGNLKDFASGNNAKVRPTSPQASSSPRMVTVDKRNTETERAPVNDNTRPPALLHSKSEPTSPGKKVKRGESRSKHYGLISYFRTQSLL